MQKVHLQQKMKFSAFLSPDTKRHKTPRNSQLGLVRTSATNFYQKDQYPESQGRIETEGPSIKGRYSYRNIKKKDTQQDKDRKNTIQTLMKDLKINYPRESKKNRIMRVKSQVMETQSGINSKTQKFKAQIAEIQSKLMRYKSKNSKEQSSRTSPQKLTSSLRLSPTKINEAALKCKQLCLNLKKKVLKETVSTTMTQNTQTELTIAQFTLGKLLGKGKFSKVYLARHKRSGLLLAIKMIKKQTIRKQKFENQLARQIVVQSFFTHVNLVQLYGMFSDQTHIYLILEYCPNGQLYDIFKVKSKLKDQEWIPIMKGICQGLFSLHLHDVIHRDLKPQNILLAFGLPKIGDFGWAVYSPSDRRQTFCGTPLYISPELLMGGSYDKQVDIWALGVMMYQFITGRIPFKLNNSTKLVQAVNGKIQYPQTLSSDSKNLLKMILNKDPQTRIAILDILQHPYLKNSYAGKVKMTNWLRTGR